MLLTIHNLPGDMRFADIKDLIREKCGLTELILDNLMSEGKGKCVTVGLADEGDAALLVQKINGLFLKGCQLYVEDVRQKKLSEQSYKPKPTSQENWPKPPMQQTSTFQAPTATSQFQPAMPPLPNQPMMPNYNNLPFYMAQAQNSHVTYNKLSTNPPQQVPFYQQAYTNYMYQQSDNQNQWSNQINTSYPEKSTFPKTASKMSDNNFPQNVDRKLDVGKDNRNFPRTQETNWNNKDDFQSYRANNDFRGQDNERYDNKNHPSRALNEPKDKYRHHNEPSPRGRERYENRPINKADERYNNDFPNSSRSSRFDQSPPRDRSFQRDRSPPRDRFRNRGSRERGLEFNAFDEQEPQRDFNRRGPNRDHGEYDQNRDFHEFERKNNRQGSFGSKRPYPNFPEKPKTFSNNPNNSTFTKSNANIFNQQAAKKGFGMQNRKGDANLSGPPAKLARFGKNEGNFETSRGGQSGINSGISTGKIPKAPQTLKAKLQQHSSFRENAAGYLAGKVIANANVGRIRHYNDIVQNLRKCIVSRIDVILGDQIVNSLDEMINSYRSKFSVNDDANFYKAVLEKLKRDKEESARNVPGSGMKTNKSFTIPLKQNTQNKKDTPGVNPYSKPQPPKPLPNKPNQNYNPYKLVNKQTGPANVNAPKNVPVQQTQQTSERLPKYPEANKQVYKDQKKIQKLEFEKEIYPMDQVLQNALSEEMNELCNAFMSACGESTDQNEEIVRQKFLKNTVKIFRKVIRLHLTKRLLDIKTNLVVRIFANPKPPKRDEMDAFLKTVGAINLKKSDKKKMFVATCDSYESYDKLLALKSTKIGDIELQFKPLHLVGPPEKKNNKSKKGGANQVSENDALEGSDEDIDDLEDLKATDFDMTNDESNVVQDNLNVSQDVVLIEDKKEIVVIEDSDHKEADKNTEKTEEATIHDEIHELDDEQDDDEDVEVYASYEKNNFNEDVFNTVDETDFAEDDLEDF